MATTKQALVARLSALYQRLRGKRLADLVLDPVCYMWVDPATATERRHEGVPYFFCSSHCVKRFESSPRRYLASAPSVGE